MMKNSPSAKLNPREKLKNRCPRKLIHLRYVEIRKVKKNLIDTFKSMKKWQKNVPSRTPQVLNY